MDGAAAFRRAFHLASPAFLAYYVLPDPLGKDIPRLALALLFVGVAMCIEIARIALRVRLIGLRPYEGNRVSAYAQGMAGLAFGIFVIQDPRIVVPVFLGMAWIDPLAAFSRGKNWPRALPALAYFALFLTTELLMKSFYYPHAVFYALAVTGTAVIVEGPKVPQVDDDLLMQVAPYVVLYILVTGIGTGWPVAPSL